MGTKEISKPHSELTVNKARLIARLMADGALYNNRTNYVLKYEVKDLESLHSFAKDVKAVYGMNVTWSQNLSGITGKPIPLVRLYSKRVFEDLMMYGKYFTKEWRVPLQVFKANKKIK